MSVVEIRHGKWRSLRVVVSLVLSACVAGPAVAQGKVDTQDPVLLAHRGLVRHAPENTLPAFAAAVALGVSIETGRLSDA